MSVGPTSNNNPSQPVSSSAQTGSSQSPSHYNLQRFEEDLKQVFGNDIGAQLHQALAVQVQQGNPVTVQMLKDELGRIAPNSTAQIDFNKIVDQLNESAQQPTPPGQAPTNNFGPYQQAIDYDPSAFLKFQAQNTQATARILDAIEDTKIRDSLEHALRDQAMVENLSKPDAKKTRDPSAGKDLV